MSFLAMWGYVKPLLIVIQQKLCDLIHKSNITQTIIIYKLV
nr:MAG TPA: hypothetical protein [Bacteriophage sp.]